MKPKKLADAQIEETCRDLLARSRTVSFLVLKAELQRRYGASGRAGRVNTILARVRLSLERLASESVLLKESALSTAAIHLLRLEERVRISERRAAEAEERERRNQDFFANRFAQQRAQLDAERAVLYASRPPENSVELYLRLYRRMADYRNRLAQYEAVEPLSEADLPSNFKGRA
jgi:hypothetical protein